MLSEQIPHRWNCEIATYRSGNCTCYVGEVAKLEAQVTALLEGHRRQWEETYYCYVCDQHGHAEDCPLWENENTGRRRET